MAVRPMFSETPSRAYKSLPWLVLLPLFVLLAWIYLPVTRGDFVADDYVFLATARMVDTPLAAFWQSHFYEPYYFRPIGVLSWWLLTQLFGLDYTSHSLINLLLHFANASLLFWLLRALALRASAVAAGVALFALGPFALATILWPSNRFDLLAVGFLLAQAITTIRALQGNVFAVPLAMLATLAACWSKELAYPVATIIACMSLTVASVPWRRRLTLFALLGIAIGAAFLVRHRIVTDAYALANADLFGQLMGGATAMVSALPRLTELIVGTDLMPWFGWGLLVALAPAILRRRRDSGVSRGLLAGVLLVLLAAFVVQTPLAKAFAPMLDGGPFGTITFARFYYAPWVAASVFVAVVLANGRLGDVAALAIVVLTVVAALATRPLGDNFAQWTRAEVRPVSVAATRVVDDTVSAGGPCVYVLLGTQGKHPLFRMFSDVTVKARSKAPEKTWRCYVMTESTPWLFAFPSSVVPTEPALRTITNPDGRVKPDSIWSTIRYRYRLPSKDPIALPEARFFDWQNGEFVEITQAVRDGSRKPSFQDR